MTTELTRAPTAVSGAAAGAAALVALGTSAIVSPNALVFGASGVALLAVGLLRGARTAVDVGALLLFFGVVAAGIEGGSVELTVVATVATVVAWDLGHGAIDLGEQLGRETSTARLEAVHLASSLIVGLLSATVGYAVYSFAAGGQPVAGLVLLLLAACFVTAGLGRRKRKSTRF